MHLYPSENILIYCLHRYCLFLSVENWRASSEDILIIVVMRDYIILTILSISIPDMFIGTEGTAETIITRVKILDRPVARWWSSFVHQRKLAWNSSKLRMDIYITQCIFLRTVSLPTTESLAYSFFLLFSSVSRIRWHFESGQCHARDYVR